MTDRLPHGYTNATSSDGLTVTKHYLGPDAVQRQTREVAALRGLAGALPVPGVVAVLEDTIVLDRAPGTAGQELLVVDPERVLHAVGAMARRIQQLAPELAGLSGEGVLVHGDFGPQNLLLDPTSDEITAVLDWELVHRGSPLEDLAWAEWIVRTHHPDLVDMLPALFTGYGERPSWDDQQAAMLAGCDRALAFVTRWSGSDSAAAELWRRRKAATTQFDG